jgi:stearoyl-CoA desaturase (Delta-9 desaturase)
MFGLLNLPWWGMVAVFFILTHITMVSVTVFLHRHQAHRALDLHPAVSHFFRFWLWLTTGMNTKQWVAIHRKHHAKCETDEDPHSPVIEGIRTVLWQGAELYRLESRNQETLDHYGHGTPNDWMERNVYRHYRGVLGILLLLAIHVILMGIPGIAIWALQMAWTPFCAAGIINGIGHYFGYRHFECKDASRNIIPWGILIAGEELHNNHHAFASSAKLSVKWYEFDIGWMYIRLLSMLGLAKVRRIAPKPVSNHLKLDIDAETLKVFIGTRWHLLARFSKQVIMPAFKQAKLKASCRKLFTRKVATLLKKPDLKQEDLGEVTQLLSTNEYLQRVVEFRNRLAAIWGRTTASQKELIEALQEWCTQAEASGILALQEFSAYLKGLSWNTK